MDGVARRVVADGSFPFASRTVYRTPSTDIIVVVTGPAIRDGDEFPVFADDDAQEQQSLINLMLRDSEGLFSNPPALLLLAQIPNASSCAPGGWWYGVSSVNVGEGEFATPPRPPVDSR